MTPSLFKGVKRLAQPLYARAISSEAGRGQSIEFNRLKVVHENFIRALETETFPEAVQTTTPTDAGLDKETYIALFKDQLRSFYLDKKSRELAAQGVGKYTIGSAGHEGNVVAGELLSQDDGLYLHYRSGALIMARTRKFKGAADPVLDCLANYVCATNTGSGGRHKVWGGTDIQVKPQTSTIASHLPKSVASALTDSKFSRVTGEALPARVVFANLGDASFNHTVASGALNAAAYHHYNHFPVPLIWMVEHNGRGISTQTPKGYIEQRMQCDPQWMYIEADGLHLPHAYQQFKQARQFALERQAPVFIVMRTVRLGGHAGPDNEVAYRPLQDLIAEEAQDPKLHTARIGIEAGFFTAHEALDITHAVIQEIEAKTQIALHLPKLDSLAAVQAALIPRPPKHADMASKLPKLSDLKKILGKEKNLLSRPLNLSQAINVALTEAMLRDSETIVFGEDVAGEKGGVYTVTKNLTARFGVARVFNSFLDETAILAYAQACAQKVSQTGRRLLPIAEIQFLAYLENAFDQLAGEAATASFFSNGDVATPMMIRIAALGCHGFGGYYHNKNAIALLRELPGLIVMCPSDPKTVGPLYQEAFRLIREENRMVVVLEPIALYKTVDLHEKGDGLWASAPYVANHAEDKPFNLNHVMTHGTGTDCVILTYGNGLYRSLKAQKHLKETHGIEAKVVDLCWLHPLPWSAILQEIADADQVLIVDECRKTGSLSEEILARFNDARREGIAIAQADRITGADCFVPLGDAAEFVFPQVDEIVSRVVAMHALSASPRL